MTEQATTTTATAADKPLSKTAQALQSETLDGWVLRENVTALAGYWGKKYPVAHNFDGKCLPGYDGEVKDRSWLEAAFAKEADAIAKGEHRENFFCTRCVLTKVKAAPVAPEKDAEPEAVKDLAEALAESITKAAPAPKAPAARKPRASRAKGKALSPEARAASSVKI